MILVKVAKVNTPVEEIPLEDGATLEDAQNATRINGGTLRVRGETDPSTALKDGDLISVVPSVKGGLS